MKVLAFDIEADGLLNEATTIHCGVVYDYDTGETETYRDPDLLYQRLLQADRLVAHNGRMYDCPVLVRLVGRPRGYPDLGPCFDTALMSRLLWPNHDSPSGGHDLDSWGTYLGLTKKHTDIDDWSVYTPEMMERCESDVQIQKALYDFILPRLSGLGPCVQIEHTVASIVCKQIENGFHVNTDVLDDLERDLQIERAAAMDDLSQIEPWVEEVELKTPAYWFIEKPDLTEKYRIKSDAPPNIRPHLERGPNKKKQVVTVFNPGSRQHICRLFKEKYNWKHTKETEKGNPIMDEAVLRTLDYPEAKTLARVFLIDKRLSQTAQWRKYLKDDGRIHGSVITNGAVSGRMTHSKPNMAQIPKVGKPWGEECRSVFGPRKGWVLVGADASGLELRMLAHYMSEWDNGEYAKVVLEGDIHTVNQEAAGLPTRDNAKTFIYGFIYGAGDAKIGQIVGSGRKRGRELKEQFLDGLPALRELIKSVKGKTELVGLDGRKYPVRSEHMALNTLLQGAGAVVMKQALIEFWNLAHDQIGPHGERWALCANVHDEVQMECEPELADKLGGLFIEGLKRAGEYFSLGIKIDGEYKVGKNWASTH